MVAAIAAAHRIPPARIVVGNGSSELLFALARACDCDRAVIPTPSYIDYATAVERTGGDVAFLPLDDRDGFRLDWDLLEAALHGGELVLLGQPNNPTGLCFDGREFLAVASRRPATTFVVDEAFADFLDGYVSLADDARDNVIVVRSFTKFYAFPGLRLGFAAACESLAARIRGQLTPWSVGTLAQAAGAAVLADDAYARRTVAEVGRLRRQLIERLQRFPGLHVYPGEANFVLVRLDRADLTAPPLADRLLTEGIAIRTFGAGQSLDDRFFRVAVRTEAENARLCDALAAAMEAESGELKISGPLSHRERPPSAAPGVRAACPRSNPEQRNLHRLPLTPTLSRRERGSAMRVSTHALQKSSPKKRPSALMLQGTSSNAGKSVLTAAFCRILLQDGFRVAPFKAQNMSLNSFVTRDGGEMGRAQVVQAQACRLEPDVRMNPILLKPNSDTGSQVIVRGKPVGNMRVGEYVDFKPAAFAAACECYDSLGEQFDAIVLEGAGSPGEVNLKHHDIVEHADGPAR